MTTIARLLHSLPAAAHIRALRHVGITDREITARARITRAQMSRAARGDLIGWEIERRILAVTIPNEAAVYEETSSVGARRRLRALHALGWPLEDLAAALDWHLHKVGNALSDKRRITVVDHLLICALYDQRWNWRPEDHGVPAEDAHQTRLVAELSGCRSPLQWDDDTIDDPTARAARGDGRLDCLDHAAAMRALDGDNVTLSPNTRTYAIRYGLRHLDMPYDVIADRLDMHHDAVKRSWERIKDRARADGEKWVDAPRFTSLADAWQWRDNTRTDREAGEYATGSLERAA